MSELYEDADMPYLVTAECHADTTAEGYLSVFYYEKEEFLEKCRAAYPDAGLTELTQIEIVSRDAAEYVTKIKVAGETYDGEQFRHALELPSACFTITASVEGVLRTFNVTAVTLALKSPSSFARGSMSLPNRR